MLALLEKTNDYEARCTREALKGIVPNEKVNFLLPCLLYIRRLFLLFKKVLIEIICTKEQHEIDVLKKTYHKSNYKNNWKRTYKHVFIFIFKFMTEIYLLM